MSSPLLDLVVQPYHIIEAFASKNTNQNRSTTKANHNVQQAVRKVLKAHRSGGICMAELLSDESLAKMSRESIETALHLETSLISTVVSAKNKRIYWVGIS